MLENSDKEYLDAVYVKKDDCNDIQSDVAAKLALADTRIKLAEQRMKQWDKLLWVIASATVGQLVTTVFGLIGGAK